MLSVASSGEVPRANGALGGGWSREGEGSVMEVLPYIKGWERHGAAVRVARNGKRGSALPMRTQHAPPEVAGRTGNVRPEAPLCSPATQGTRLPVQAPDGSQRATLPALVQVGRLSKKRVLPRRNSQRSKVFWQTSGRSSPVQSGAHDSAGQGASKARRSARNLNPRLARRPPLEETGVSKPHGPKLLYAVRRP